MSFITESALFLSLSFSLCSTGTPGLITGLSDDSGSRLLTQLSLTYSLPSNYLQYGR